MYWQYSAAIQIERTMEMPSPNPSSLARTLRADCVSVSGAQLLLQYLLALEVGAAESEACELASTAPHGHPCANVRWPVTRR
jgi:hypothetical protein